MPVLTIPNSFQNSTRNATTLAGGAKPVDADKLNENFDAIVQVFTDGLDDENFRQTSEAKVVFSETGHSHDGIDSPLIEASPESGVVFVSTGGHHHDGTDSKLLARATETKQGGVIAVTGTTGVVAAGVTPEEIGLIASIEEIYSVKVWQVISASASNRGQGVIMDEDPPLAHPDTAPFPSTLGYYFTLEDNGDGTLLKIYNKTVAGSVTFNWAVLTI